MNDAQKRDAVKALYPGRRWAQRVDRMTEAQILGIYTKKILNNPQSEEKK